MRRSRRKRSEGVRIEGGEGNNDDGNEEEEEEEKEEKEDGHKHKSEPSQIVIYQIFS